MQALDPPLILYSYWRSSASYRVRLALAIKGLAHELRPVHLVRNGGEQHASAFRSLNPQALVPTLVHGDLVLSQSLAMIEYLDERFPEVPLLPSSITLRAQARAIAQLIACDIHPLNNLRVLAYLVEVGGFEEAERLRWYRHWTESGLAAVEELLRRHASPYCCGEEPGLADCCLLPQVYNARRFDCSLDGMERIRAICARLENRDDLQSAIPENQPDAG